MLDSVDEFWNKWEIRVLVISSLLLQIFLLITAGSRKRVVSMWRGMFLWTAYLCADYVATFALGYLSQTSDTNNKKSHAQSDQDHHLLVFWAPFLLLHLGGQDTITALSIEDNELWKRHLLTLISQVFLAIYVFAKSWRSTRLLVPAVFMFAAGFLKYAERTWALKRASMSSLRSSMITEPDPGPNYAKFMEEYSSSIEAGLEAKIVVVEESALPSADLENQQDAVHTNGDVPYPMVVSQAYMFLQTFKRLFVDLILSFEHRKESQDFFVDLPVAKAYKVIEIELSLMYEILHTKAAIIYTWYGWLFRFATLICTTIAFSFFCSGKKHGYDPKNVIVTYILLSGAVLLEIVAIISMLVSFWTFAALKKFPSLEKVADILFPVVQKIRPEKVPRWSDKMAQFNLINYCLNDNPSLFLKTMKLIGLKETWDNYRYTTPDNVNDELKALVFTELKNKMNDIADTASYRSFNNHRGQWALQRKGYYKELSWSTVDAELDESILLWHIATDLLFNSKEAAAGCLNREISRKISNYMLFLLVMRTPMLPAGIGQIRFGDTCAEAKNFLRTEIDRSGAATKILGVSTEHEPRKIKGDRSKSVLFSGCRLAHQLQDLFPIKDLPADVADRNLKKMWELISVVWVEMLCFAASKCSGSLHARQLSMGGELLTVVWFLMAHLGMGEQYRIEAGHARAKLIVEK